MIKLMKTALLASGLLCSSLALAQGGSTSRFMQFFDTNKDGVVSLDEFNSAMLARFHAMDTDHNGVVSAKEFYAYIQHRRLQHREARLKQMDANGDGRVTEAEYLAYMNKEAKIRFDRMDKNHDGILTANELVSGRHHHGTHNWKRLFHKLDKNGDGVLSLDESRAAWTAWFERMDSNGDKVVTADEVRAFHDHQHARRVTR